MLGGGAGKDTLNGGAGDDRFVYSNPSDSPLGARDTITKFEASGQGNDTIDLSQIDANTGVGGNQAFKTYFEGGSHSPAPQTLWFHDGTLYGDVNGGHSWDFAINLPGVDFATLNFGGSGNDFIT